MMMPFTDDDLKQLKEWGCVPGNEWTYDMEEKFHIFCSEKMQSLIARLEAAERYAAYLAPIDSEGMKLRASWHETCGQDIPIISNFIHSSTCWCGKGDR